MNYLNRARVLVTRPEHQAGKLCQLLVDQGLAPVRFPTLAIQASSDMVLLRRTLANLGKFQWLIFISANAVNFALKANGGKIPQLNSVSLAAVGQATALALADAGLTVNVVPEQGFSSEALLSEPRLQNLYGQRILIVRGEGGREELAETLRERGAETEYLEVYRRVVPEIDKTEMQGLLEEQELAAITITSGEALQNLLMMTASEYHPLLLATPLIVVSGRIAQLADDMGFKQIVVAAQVADMAIIEAVTMCLTGK
jgi:uroporphyrinogen-III synthase